MGAVADKSLDFNLAEAVNARDGEKALSLLKQGGGQRVSYVELNAKDAFNPEKWPGFIDQIRQGYSKFLRAETSEEALQHLEDFRILCAFRVGPYGMERLNEVLLKVLSGSLRKPMTPVPIMVTRNEKQLFDLANGDVGVIMPDEPEYFQIKSSEGVIRKIRIELLTNREYAFATTIHKSQGSEFDEIAIVIPPVDPADSADARHETILTKEIFYTGITRAKKHARIYAGDESVRNCCAASVERVSGLKK